MKKIILGVFVLIAGLTLAFTESAFTDSNQMLQTEWTFMGNSSSDVIDGFQYELTGTPPTSCNSGVDIPCKLSTPAEIDTQAELDAYILDQFGDDAAVVTAAADSKRASE